MADEFNKIEVNNGYSPDGQNKLSTASYVHEENKFSGNAKQPEINKREAPLSVAKKIKKNTRFTGLIIKAVAVVAAAVVGVVEVENLLPADYKVELFVEAGEDFVSYFAEFGEYSPENNEITVSVYNDFTKREKKFELPEGEERFHGVDGFEENLQSDMKYTIEVLDGRKTVAKETFRTAKQLQERLEFDIDFVEIGEFSAFYVGNLGNYVPENSYLTAIITGGDLRDETILQMIDGESRIEGIFENLSPDTYYTVEIFDGSRVIARNSFRTTEETFVNAFELAIEAMENGVFFSASLGGYENVNEFFNVRIYNANDESDSYGSECEVISEEVERYIQGEIFDLSPDTDYIIEIYDGEVLVCRDFFRTQEQSSWFDISVDADGNSAAFYAYLSDYEPTGDLKIVVESDGETIGEASAQMKGGELAAYIEGLSPLTYYMATLYDDEKVIGETSFETEYLV
ncbi:MAG: hypothetical protein IJU84_08940, partial [Clostridia bacterium]|nr:hypothetical protein [Clostridia bacterium]